MFQSTRSACVFVMSMIMFSSFVAKTIFSVMVTGEKAVRVVV